MRTLIKRVLFSQILCEMLFLLTAKIKVQQVPSPLCLGPPLNQVIIRERKSETGVSDSQGSLFCVVEPFEPSYFRKCTDFFFSMIHLNFFFVPQGWTQRRLPSMDTEDFETIPSSAEELSNSSDGEEDSSNKNVHSLPILLSWMS